MGAVSWATSAIGSWGGDILWVAIGVVPSCGVRAPSVRRGSRLSAKDTTSPSDCGPKGLTYALD